MKETTMSNTIVDKTISINMVECTNYAKSIIRVIDSYLNGIGNQLNYTSLENTAFIDDSINELLTNYSKSHINDIKNSLQTLFILANITDEFQKNHISINLSNSKFTYNDNSTSMRMLNILRKYPSFIIEPASAKYHGNYKGGLLNHSLTVLKCAIQMAPIYKVSYNSIDIIAIIFHDLCKVGKYIFKQYKNDEGKWSELITYNKDESCIEHGAESLRRMLNIGIKISETWQIAIAYHMGVYNVSNTETINFSKMAGKYPEVLLMHHADALSAAVYEKENKTDN